MSADQEERVRITSVPLNDPKAAESHIRAALIGYGNQGFTMVQLIPAPPPAMPAHARDAVAGRMWIIARKPPPPPMIELPRSIIVETLAPQLSVELRDAELLRACPPDKRETVIKFLLNRMINRNLLREAII